MGKIWMPGGGGGGAKSDDTNVTKEYVLAGRTYIGSDTDDEVGTGTMPDKAGITQSAAGSVDSANKRVQLTIPSLGRYSTTSKLYIAYSTLASLIGLTAAKLWPNNTVLGITSSKQMMSGQTITPSTIQQRVSCGGKAMSSDIVVNAIPNIRSAITNCVSATWSKDDLYARMQRGYYNTNATSGYPETLIPGDTVRSVLGISSNKIIKGYNIANVQGSASEFKQFTGNVAPVASTKTFTDIDGARHTCYYLDLDLGFYPMAIQAVRNDGSGPNYYFWTGDQYNLCIVNMNAGKPYFFSYTEPNISWQSTHIYLPVLTYSTATWDVNIAGRYPN